MGRRRLADPGTECTGAGTMEASVSRLKNGNVSPAFRGSQSGQHGPIHATLCPVRSAESGQSPRVYRVPLAALLGLGEGPPVHHGDSWAPSEGTAPSPTLVRGGRHGQGACSELLPRLRAIGPTAVE